MIYKEYDLTFDDVFSAVVEASENSAFFDRLRIALNGIFSTPNLRRKLVDAINDYCELSDGIGAYMIRACNRSRDPILDVLIDAQRRKFRDAIDVFQAFVYNEFAPDEQELIKDLIFNLNRRIQC